MVADVAQTKVKHVLPYQHWSDEMLYGNLKNMTYTQSAGNCNAFVGFSLALIFRDFYPSTFTADWYWYLLGAFLFVIFGLISTYQQFKNRIFVKTSEANGKTIQNPLIRVFAPYMTRLAVTTAGVP